MKKILIVDDEPAIVELTAAKMRAGGYETIEAYNGLTALVMARNERPDLILLDVLLPD